MAKNEAKKIINGLRESFLLPIVPDAIIRQSDTKYFHISILTEDQIREMGKQMIEEMIINSKNLENKKLYE